MIEQVADAIAKQEGFYVKGSVAKRNNNPGNLKMGKLARSFGAVKMDRQHHAIFPSASAGWDALFYLLRTKFKGKNLNEIGPVWAEDPKWAQKVSKLSGVHIYHAISSGDSARILVQMEVGKFPRDISWRVSVTADGFETKLKAEEWGNKILSLLRERRRSNE